MIVPVLSDLNGCPPVVSEPQPDRTHDRAAYSLADQIWNHSMASIRVAVERVIGHAITTIEYFRLG
jgi:hypothetical protein